MKEKISTKENWENFWRDQENIHEVYSNEDRIYLNLIKVADINGKKILEVGAGSGRDSFRLAQEMGMVYVLDYSPQALKIVKNLNTENASRVYLIQGDAFQIPIPDASMDIVFHQGLMEHFKDPMPLLKEHFRILKPGGFLLVDVPQKYHVYTVIKQILIFFNKWFAGWETQFSLPELKKLTKEAGFSVCHQYGRWMRPSLFYRILRELLKKANIKLAHYPKGFKYTRKMRDWLRDKFIAQPWAYYTFLDIGVIGQKKD